jgi:glycerophosphoryl diester phosphodiesterase
MYRPFFLLFFSCIQCLAQGQWPHPNAHAHNDYMHLRPLREALENGFSSVEADVHLQKGKLLVAHDHATTHSPTLERLYFIPLDSIIKSNGGVVYTGSKTPLYLMIDVKTESESTYQALKELLSHYPRLHCTSEACAVKIFLSGERPLATIMNEGYTGFGIDGRPDDVGKGLPVDLMPVISDNYKNWSTWKGKTPDDKDLERIKALAQRVHAEGKKLRLWAIPDQELAWRELLNAGVDLINTDHLPVLNKFLTNKGL